MCSALDSAPSSTSKHALLILRDKVTEPLSGVCEAQDIAPLGCVVNTVRRTNLWQDGATVARSSKTSPPFRSCLKFSNRNQVGLGTLYIEDQIPVVQRCNSFIY